MPLARLFRLADPARGVARQTRPVTHRPEPARATGATTRNGDGFGVGWYDEGGEPRLYRSTHPAWNDRKLGELAAGISCELLHAVDDSLFTSIEGTSDSELMFYLALTFGLESDPVAAVEKMVGLVEETGQAHSVGARSR